MTWEEAIQWCVEHAATVEFSYHYQSLDGKRHEPYVTVRWEHDDPMHAIGLVTFKVEEPTFLKAVKDAKEQTDVHGND